MNKKKGNKKKESKKKESNFKKGVKSQMSDREVHSSVATGIMAPVGAIG
ncbi:hypothetical protein SO574_18505 [Vibrio alfacsensis]|nr:hypothetical protein [Vibrio alfacsensis]WQE77769.1 hypothetical protein SO574_18505 [Vibrio alfacsensis]